MLTRKSSWSFLGIVSNRKDLIGPRN